MTEDFTTWPLVELLDEIENIVRDNATILEWGGMGGGHKRSNDKRKAQIRLEIELRFTRLEEQAEVFANRFAKRTI